MRWSFVATHGAHDLWDDEGWEALSTRHLQLARDVGALGLLPIAIAQRVGMHLHAGEFGTAAALVEETAAITEATGADLPPYSALALAAWQGHDAEATRLIQATLKRVTARGEGMGLSLTLYTSAVLHNGLGRHREALDAADPDEVTSPTFTLIHEYEGTQGTDGHKMPVKLYHLDLYRLEGERQLDTLGLDELAAPDSIVLVEWGEKFPSVVKRSNGEIVMTSTGGEARKIVMSLKE